jgi:hypothetical protein
MSSGNFNELRYAYRVGLSTETALLRVTNYVVRATCDQQTTVLLALDISTAFDTVKFDVLLRRIICDFGIGGSALNWISSLITVSWFRRCSF